MKKILIILCLSLFTGTTLLADIGTYTASSTKRGVEAFINLYGDLVVKIKLDEVQGPRESTLTIKGETEIEAFHEMLSFCRKKYNEWSQVARAHLIDNYLKIITVSFPKFEIWWDKMSIGEPAPSAVFKVFDGEARLVISGTATRLHEELFKGYGTSTHDWNITFISDDEIQTLLYWTDVNTLKYELQKKKTIDGLFK